MKRFLSLLTILALTTTLTLANAHEDPKKAPAKETKMSCCSAKDMKAAADTKTNTEKKGCCSKSKCGDDCKMSEKSAKPKASEDKN